MTKLNFLRFALLVVFASLTACMTAPPPLPVPAPTPAAVYVPEPAVEPVPAPVPEPVYVAPDYTTLEGHSSYTTPVPVEPVEVQDMGPVIDE